MKPSLLITCGVEGVGKDIVDFFAPNSLSLSRRNGYDIGLSKDRQKIIEKSLEYDIFVNHAHNGHFEGQVALLYEVYYAWKKSRKSGYIINIGSYSTYNIGKGFRRYAVLKYALDIASQQCCKEIENGLTSFRMTNIKPGMLDTPKSQKKPHWTGVGIRGGYLAEMIAWLYALPPDLLVPEAVLAPVNQFPF